MKPFKLLPPLALVIVLVLTGSCSRPTPTVSQTYAPIISDAETSISDMASGFNVNYLVNVIPNADASLGHLIYYYDVTPPTVPGQAAHTVPGTYIVMEQPAVWKNVTPGEHTFSAQVVYTDNDTPFNPPVIARSIITVPAAISNVPEIRNMGVLPTLPHPTLSTEPPQPIVRIDVQVSCIIHQFKLDDDSIGQLNVPGEGHLIYYLDLDPPTAPGKTAVTDPGTCKVTTNDFQLWEQLAPGRHVFSLQIVNNDNTPLDPPVTAQVIITLPSQL